MKLEQLQHIIEIEKQRSISKAAKALYIGQPTLSASLASLEEEIGVTLFERTYTGVVATKDGTEAVCLAKQALEAVERIRNLERKNEGLTETVTVVIAYIYNYLYNKIVSQFHLRYPHAKLHLRVRSHDEFKADMLEGKADIGLFSTSDSVAVPLKTQLKQKGYILQSFDHYVVQAFVGPDSRYIGHDSISLQELRKEQLLANFEEWKDVIEKKVQPEQPVMLVFDNESMKQMICRGEGIAIFPALYANQSFYCEGGSVHAMDIEGATFQEVENCMIFKQRQSILEEQVCQLLKEVLLESSLV